MFLWQDKWWSDQFTILHKPRQHSCRGFCKIVTWFGSSQSRFKQNIYPRDFSHQLINSVWNGCQVTKSRGIWLIADYHWLYLFCRHCQSEITTTRSRCNTMHFIQELHDRNPIVCLWWRRMGCQILSMIHISQNVAQLPHLLQTRGNWLGTGNVHPNIQRQQKRSKHFSHINMEWYARTGLVSTSCCNHRVGTVPVQVLFPQTISVRKSVMK